MAPVAAPAPTPFDPDAFLKTYPDIQIKNGKVVPHPNEYDSVNFGLKEVFLYFLSFYFLIFLPLIGLH